MLLIALFLVAGLARLLCSRAHQRHLRKTLVSLQKTITHLRYQFPSQYDEWLWYWGPGEEGLGQTPPFFDPWQRALEEELDYLSTTATWLANTSPLKADDVENVAGRVQRATQRYERWAVEGRPFFASLFTPQILYAIRLEGEKLWFEVIGWFGADFLLRTQSVETLCDLLQGSLEQYEREMQRACALLTYPELTWSFWQAQAHFAKVQLLTLACDLAQKREPVLFGLEWYQVHFLAQLERRALHDLRLLHSRVVWSLYQRSLDRY